MKAIKKKLLFNLNLLFILGLGEIICCMVLFPSFSVAEEKSPNVLLITLDTTRPDRLGYHGYNQARTPNIDHLADNGTIFLNAYTSVPLTLPSHCSLLTGTYPLFHGVRNNGFYYLPPELETLAEVLKGKGFETAAFVSSFTLDSRFGLNQGFDFYDDNFQEDEILKNFRSERRADKTYASFSAWLEQNFLKRFFVWIHFFDPHLPYDPPSPFKEEFSANPYDGEIAFVDFYLGKIMEKLRDKNILQETLIVITADHGEALGERREIDHGLFLYDNTLKIPLLFYSESLKLPRKRISSRVRIIDIMPTILDLLSLPIPDQVQGTSLRPFFYGHRNQDLDCYIETYYPYENFGWSPLEGVIFDKWKFIRAPKLELYDLSNDPNEQLNLAAKNKKITAKLKERLTKYKTNLTFNLRRSKRALFQEEQERLRSLGYLVGGPEEKILPENLPDPKDKIDDYLLYFQGNIMETQGNYEKAVETYQKVLVKNPYSPWNYVNLAFVYMKMDKITEAISLLEKARKKFPHSIVILSRLLTFHLRAENWQPALDLGQSILNLDPHYFDALFLMGSTLAKLGRWQEALTYYEKALAIEPENKILRHRYAYTLMATGRYKEAEQAFRQLKGDYPSDFSIDLDLALLYESGGKIEEATKILDQTVARYPNADTYYAYALHLNKIGKAKEAIIYLKKFLEVAPEKDQKRRAAAQALLEQLTKK